MTAAGLAGVLAAAALLPISDDGPVLCLFRRVTSLPCPSCGMTRAFVALARGEFARAVAYNIAAPFVYAAVWLGLALAVGELASGRALIAPLWKRTWRIVLPVVVVVMATAWVLHFVEPTALE